MRLTYTLSVLAVASVAHALSECLLNCQKEAATNDCATSNYNETSCYCNNGNFVLDVQSCLENGCSDDIGEFHHYRGTQCSAGSSTSTAPTPESTNTITLTICILECQSTAANSVGGVCSSTTYNDTACYCDSDRFATQAQDCIFADCAGEDGTFHQWRGDVCSSNSTTNPTATSSSSSDSSNTSGGSGLSKGAIAGISVGCVVAGLAAVFAAFVFFLRRFRRAAIRKRYQGGPIHPLGKMASRSTTTSQDV